ncbi:MAG: ATP-dependent Lhr-like helicase, partial [Gammaproteobacteria bacterium]
SRLREEMDGWLATDGDNHAKQQLQQSYGLDENAAAQLTEYLGAAWRAFGERLPTASQMIAERFFDEAGDMHLVIHSPNGSRLNRAFGLALRKRFCRRFNFELQAAALEDCIVLSLGETHSFEIDEVAKYLNSTSVREVLIQALLDAPVFPTHWRWVTNIALAVRRFSNGRKVPPQFQRSDAEDLVAVVFPDQLACFENIQGAREVPEHPLVDQTLWDCLHDVMDVNGLETLLKGLESGTITWTGRDMVSPSPLAEEVLNAKPYAFLDDAPAEERRTLAVQSRGVTDEGPADYSRLDPAAIDRVCGEAWPDVNSADELHDALVCGSFIAQTEIEGRGLSWHSYFEDLVSQRRATRLQLNSGPVLWVAAERLGEFQTLPLEISQHENIQAIGWNNTREPSAEEAMVALLRSRLEISGPVTLQSISALSGFPLQNLQPAILQLQQQGFAISGEFRLSVDEKEWCDRRLLARIHRYTLKTLRAQIEPVSLSAFMRFLFEWQHVDQSSRMEGPEGTAEIISQLEGYGAPLKSWESDILPARIYGYSPGLLDQIGMSGRILWRRHHGWKSTGNRPGSRGLANVSVGFYAREDNPQWQKLDIQSEMSPLSSSATVLTDLLHKMGACYFDDMVDHGRMLPTQLEDALAELIARGLVTCDGFNGFRALLLPQSRRRQGGRSLQRRHRRLSSTRIEQSGRWSLLKPVADDNQGADNQTVDKPGKYLGHDDELLDVLCDVLLHRYGVVCRAICDHEKGLPPWRALLPYLRRLEARGEVRGGRFIAKLQGEQFALPEAVKILRKHRQSPAADIFVRISSSDPLNLTGGILPGPRISQNQALLFKNGILVAHARQREVEFIGDPDADEQWKIREKLLVSGARSVPLRARIPH